MQLQTIAFFNWLYPYGGAETVTHNLASFFHKQGYRIILYIEKLNRELLCDEERAIFQFRELPAGPDPKKPANVDFLCRPLDRITRKRLHRTEKMYAGMMPHLDRMLLLCDQYKEDFMQALKASGHPGSDAPASKYGAILNPLLPAAAAPVSPKEKIVLYVGRFHRAHKRVDRLLKIWKTVERRNPDWKLILVGCGEEDENLRKLAVRLRLQRAEFAGYHADVTPFYRRATFMCLTSNFEGLPMSLMEGQQYGVIPVSFDSYAGIREITCDGACGIMVPSYSLRKYAALLNAALADTELQERMRTRALEASRRYDLENIGNQWLSLFNEM